MSDHASSRVRGFLRQELPRWRAEGLIDGRAEEALVQRYGLAASDGAGLAVAALYVLAAGLVGGGVISLVAWHWDDMSRALRLGLLGAALVAAHGAGYWMWQVSARRPRLGHAISLLGTILFGASIGLVAQIFQVSGPWYGAFGAWALGALVAGLALRSLPALCFSAFLGLIVWGPGFIGDHARSGDLVAWVAGGAFVALAFRFRSRVLFLVSAAGLAVVLAVAAAELGRIGWHVPPELPFAALLATAGAVCAFAVWGATGGTVRMAADAAWLGRLAFYGIGYVLSYEEPAKDIVEHPPGTTRAWITCILPLVVAGVALLLAAHRSRRAGAVERITALIAVAFSVLFTIAARAEHHPLGVVVLANVAVLSVAAARIARGLATRQRLPFWEGLAVAGVLALSRFFEIESLLWLKGAGFIACGAAVVVAALAFERRLQAIGQEVPHV